MDRKLKYRSVCMHVYVRNYIYIYSYNKSVHLEPCDVHELFNLHSPMMCPLPRLCFVCYHAVSHKSRQLATFFYFCLSP